MLFIISGYLHAMHDDQPYKQRIKKRLRVLLIPYLIWSAAGLAFVYVLELFPSTKQLVQSSGIMQVSSTHLLLHDYYSYEVLLNGYLFLCLTSYGLYGCLSYTILFILPCAGVLCIKR